MEYPQWEILYKRLSRHVTAWKVAKWYEKYDLLTSDIHTQISLSLYVCVCISVCVYIHTHREIYLHM